MPNNSKSVLKIQSVEVEQLLLDPDNPRLESIATGPTQEELVKAMWKEMAVSEVALSIAENGFFPEEPLFAISAPKTFAAKEKTLTGDLSKPRYIIVEGNRRLTAVKLLRDNDLKARIRATDLPSISKSRRDELDTLPISIYPNKESLWEYFGFRHVNGPKEWDSLSKAAYIAHVVRNFHKSLDVIARKIGDQHSTVERIYRGYVLLEQAEESTKFHRDDRNRNRFYFSHLYTAASYPEILNFLGTDSRKSLAPNPVPRKHLSDLEEFMMWLFGSRERGMEAVVRKQNPDLGYLRAVIGNPQALAALRSGVRLERSFAISLGDERRFEEALAAAKDSLQEAKGTVTTGYKGSRDLLEQMESIILLAASIELEMKGVARKVKAK
ncbi:MAG TPA: hypothetical protein VEW46_20120 [Pyrinomonadaceae bacterium]|nr:hypothetical protein [Pyrinomonadaceae bacterium]